MGDSVPQAEREVCEEAETCCWASGWGALVTVARAKTECSLMEGKGKHGAAVTPAANLAIGSLFKILLHNLHLYPLRSIKKASFAYREETLLIHNCLLGI